MNKRYLILPMLVISLFIGYKIGFNEAIKTNGVYRDQIINETLNNNLMPQCFMNNCPEYDFFDTDGDGLTESVVTEHTTMTQQAGRIWIIDQGRVVFKSDEMMQVNVKPREDNNRFVITYATEGSISPNFLDSFTRDKYLFMDGKYVLNK